MDSWERLPSYARPGWFPRKESSNDMAFPHPQARKDYQGDDNKPNAGGVGWKHLKRAVNVTENRNAENDVNPAKNRAFGGFFHDWFSPSPFLIRPFPAWL